MDIITETHKRENMEAKEWLKFIKWIMIAGILILTINIQMSHKETIGTMRELNQHQAKREKQISELKMGISQDNKRRSKILIVVDIIQKRNSGIEHKTMTNFAEYIVDYTEHNVNVDYLLLTALITQESNFNDSAYSSAGAKGLAQIMDLTAQDICEHLRIPYTHGITFIPKHNIMMASWYLERLINHYRDTSKAIAHYNGGGLNAYRYGLKLAQQKDYKLTDEETEALGRLSEETDNYVKRVLGFYGDYISNEVSGE